MQSCELCHLLLPSGLCWDLEERPAHVVECPPASPFAGTTAPSGPGTKNSGVPVEILAAPWVQDKLESTGASLSVP